jgi:hypothetical protein
MRIWQRWSEAEMRKWVVPTKQCRSIMSTSYILWLLTARGEKSGDYKARQGGISKPALLCRDYPKMGSYLWACAYLQERQQSTSIYRRTSGIDGYLVIQ